jgi:hypothetical protein
VIADIKDPNRYQMRGRIRGVSRIGNHMTIEMGDYLTLECFTSNNTTE